MPPSITLVPTISSKLSGGRPFSVRKNFFTSARVAPGAIGAAIMWCGSAPTLSKAILLGPAFRPWASKLYSWALTVACASGSSPPALSPETSKRVSPPRAKKGLPSPSPSVEPVSSA